MVVVAADEHAAVPGAGREVHLQQYRGEERTQEVADDGLDDGESGVAVGLACHDDVGGHGGGDAAEEEEADEEPGVHEGRGRGAEADDGEGRGRRDEVALQLDEGVDLPLFVVVDQHAGGQGAAVDEEDYADGEVGDDGALYLLLG